MALFVEDRGIKPIILLKFDITKYIDFKMITI